MALWNGRNFLTIGLKLENWIVKTEGYYEESAGCFQPFYPIDEGKMIEPFDTDGWEAHYGRVLEITNFERSV